MDPDRQRRHDLCLLVHSNRISLITLAPSHPILERGLVVSRVDCAVSKRLDRKDNKAVGKSKKGGQNLAKDSVVCYLEVGCVVGGCPKPVLFVMCSGFILRSKQLLKLFHRCNIEDSLS